MTSCRNVILTVVASLIAILGVSAVIYALVKLVPPSPRPSPPDPEVAPPPSPSKEHKFRNGAVCSDATVCSKIGRDILEKNGTAIDAAVATLFCNGLVSSQSMGLGGGFMMVLYDSNSKQSHALIARESAPELATDQLYRDDHGASKAGPKAIGVPGELRGYWAAHQRFGRLPWVELITPTIKLCENGYEMTKHQRDSLGYNEDGVRGDPLLRQTFVDPSTGNFLPAGTIIKRREYCRTLHIISREGGDTLYNGTLAESLYQDIKSVGGVITRKDLAEYQVKWTEPVRTRLSGGLTILGAPPPSSGVLVAFILRILDGFHLNPTHWQTVDDTILTYHYIVEAFKFAFAKRAVLGDPDFVNINETMDYLLSPSTGATIRKIIESRKTSGDPKDYDAEFYNKEDAGTAHVSVIDTFGNAVSVTSSINIYFGAGVTSKQTGIILNSGIDDFSFPWFENFFGLGFSPTNRIAPGKRAMSSMSPTIVLENGKVRLVVGASGGSRIVTAVSLVIMRHLWAGEDLKGAIDASRFHHQLTPPQMTYEYGIVKAVIEGLTNLGHNVTRYRDRGSIICGLARLGEYIYGNADYRKAGEVFGL